MREKQPAREREISDADDGDEERNTLAVRTRVKRDAFQNQARRTQRGEKKKSAMQPPLADSRARAPREMRDNRRTDA